MKTCWKPVPASWTDCKDPVAQDARQAAPTGLRSNRFLSFVHLAIVTMVAIGMLGPAGCSGKSKRRMKFRSLEDAMRVALPEELPGSHPDQRRLAVTRIAESRSVEHEEVFYVLDAVARTDPVSQIRCIAIRGLARYEDARPVGTVLKILQSEEKTVEALPADDDVRWEALRALVLLADRGVLDEQQRKLACDICIRLSQPNANRNVRIVAIGAMAFFQDRVVLDPLIRILRDTDFAIAEQAELSLIRLTGRTNDFDADAWEQWLATVENPFEHAGEIPEFDRPSGPSWWEQQKRAFRRAIKLNND